MVIGHINKVSKQFTTTITSFNSLVGSVDQKLVPGARKMSELDPGMGELDDLQMIETQVRASRSAGELEAGAELIEDSAP